MAIIKNLNIFDLNFLLILVGFPLFTTFVDSSIASIAYRGFALTISLICLYRSGIRFSQFSILTKCLIFVFALFIFRVSLDEIIFNTSIEFNSSKNNVLLFAYGIVGFPSLALLASYDKLNYKKDLFILFFLLLIFLSIGIKNVGLDASEERENLNNRQSTLAFGDNGAYLGILSFVMLCKAKELNLKKTSLLLFLFGLIICAISIAKAGSRGPLLGFLAALIFLVFHAPKGMKLLFIGGVIWVITLGSVAVLFLARFSPVLYMRIMNSIEHGDSSGRDVLFSQALEQINNNPILGSEPVLLEENGAFSSYHNCYLDIFVGLGIFIGFFYVILILISAFKSLYKKGCTAFQLFIFGMFWFYLFRALSGVMIVSNAIYVCVVLLTSIFLTRRISLN